MWVCMRVRLCEEPPRSPDASVRPPVRVSVTTAAPHTLHPLRLELTRTEYSPRQLWRGQFKHCARCRRLSVSEGAIAGGPAASVVLPWLWRRRRRAVVVVEDRGGRRAISEEGRSRLRWTNLAISGFRCDQWSRAEARRRGETDITAARVASH